MQNRYRVTCVTGTVDPGTGLPVQTEYYQTFTAEDMAVNDQGVLLLKRGDKPIAIYGHGKWFRAELLDSTEGNL